MSQPKRQEETLIERAARVYDFGAHLRGREPAGRPPATNSVRPEPVEGRATASVPFVESRPSTGSGRTEVGEARPYLDAAPPAPPTAEILSLDAAMTLAAIPPELREGAAPAEEWSAPLDIARIDRIMLAEKGMLVPGAPIGALAEEFRLVKRQLLLNARAATAKLGDRARTILVGSGKPGEGKTFCAINLAISLAAEKDVEVVLIDGDFAKPDVMPSLGLDDSIGFLDVLGDGAIDPEECIVRTDVPQLALLPAGKRTHADTELLASDRTGQVLDRLLAANPKRIIVFDSPPALAASPASVLASLIGQVMLVVRADRTTEADVREAVALLDRCETISLVLNSVSYEPGRGRFGSYYGQEK